MVTDGQGFAVSMELIRRGADATSMLGELASRLERALPHLVETERSRLRKRFEVRIDLRPESFRIEANRQRLSCFVDHVVRDVRVRTDEVGIDEWWTKLGHALDQEAARSTTVRLALEEALR